MSVKIHNTIERPDGVPQAGTVLITISWDSSVSPLAVDPIDDVTIEGPGREITDNYGYWETTVVPNEIIEPEDSVYKVVETVGDSIKTYFISVPNGDENDDFWIGDILTTKPTWEE